MVGWCRWGERVRSGLQPLVTSGCSVSRAEMCGHFGRCAVWPHDKTGAERFRFGYLKVGRKLRGKGKGDVDVNVAAGM